MAIEEVPAKFKASDGTEFDTRDEAMAHEDAQEAYDRYQDAIEELENAILESQLTADGYKFSLRRHDYYWVDPDHGSFHPRIVTVGIYADTFSLAKNDNGQITCWETDNGEELKNVRIRDLFVSKDAAKEKVLRLIDGKLLHLQDYRKKVEGIL